MCNSVYYPADYISGVATDFKAILFEFEYRELS